MSTKFNDGSYVFGVDAPLSLNDEAVVTFAVMVTLDCRLADREVQVARPAYEYSLLKARYERRGGSVSVMTAWLFDPKQGREVRARKVDLSRSTLLAEMARCQSAYRESTGGGVISLFDAVYGKGTDNRFVKTVNNQARAWKTLSATLQTAKRPPTVEELQEICDLSLPPVEGEIDIERITMEDVEPAGTDAAPQADEHDPITDLLNSLTGQGIDPDVALEVTTLYSQQGKVTKAQLALIPALAQKDADIRKVQQAFQSWADSAKT